MDGITVVGMGPGGIEYITEAALQAIKRADVLVGGRRHLELFGHLAVEKHPVTANLEPLMGIMRQRAADGKHVVVMASGDPGFYGILSTLRRRLPGVGLEVIPGISSFQLACARLGLTWEDACLTSCHGRDPSALAAAVRNNRMVITLTDPRHNPPALARALLEKGIADLVVHVACNLSYPDEVINTTTLRDLGASGNWPPGNCVMVIINEE